MLRLSDLKALLLSHTHFSIECTIHSLHFPMNCVQQYFISSISCTCAVCRCTRIIFNFIQQILIKFACHLLTNQILLCDIFGVLCFCCFLFFFKFLLCIVGLFVVCISVCLCVCHLLFLSSMPSFFFYFSILCFTSFLAISSPYSSNINLHIIIIYANFIQAPYLFMMPFLVVVIPFIPFVPCFVFVFFAI